MQMSIPAYKKAQAFEKAKRGGSLRDHGELKNSREVVLAFLEKDGSQFRFASDELKGNREFVIYVVSKYPAALEYAADSLKNDIEVVLAAVLKHGSVIAHGSENIRNNRKVGLAAVAQYGQAIIYLSDELQRDRDINLIAIASDRKAWNFVHQSLKNDPLLNRLKNLEKHNVAPAFLALESLKAKLKKETHTERKEAAKKMIADIEEAIVGHYEKKDSFNFEYAFSQAIETARPFLERQTGWKLIIDALANGIMNFICTKTKEQKQGKSTYKSFFFTNPNPFKKEIKEARVTISNEFEAPST